MKRTAILVILAASLGVASPSFAQTAYGGNVGGGGPTGGIAGAAPQSTTAGDVSPISGGNGGIGGTPGNTTAAGTPAGPGNSGAYPNGTARYR